MFPTKEPVLADPRGARDERPLWFQLFKKKLMQFFEKNGHNNSLAATTGVGAPVWEILDPLLPGTVRKSLCKKFTIPVLIWTLPSPFNLPLAVSPLPASVFVIAVIITSA